MNFNFFLRDSRPIKIVDIGENHKLILNENNLKKILYHPKARNKQVCLISVAGAFRKGKSFLLNFFIRFFKNRASERWIENESDSLKGFHWRSGSDRDTTGIFMWSEPYLIKTLKNEEVAVLLMDTQGSFDSTATVKECATLFALSLMVSSIQIYNLSQNIQEDDLCNLHLFSDYGRLALNSTQKTPFQMLIFLVRDWPYNYEYPYGFSGGQEFLNKRLQIKSYHDVENLKTREFIKKCFKQIKCFLMPHPGLKASSSPYFQGNLNELDLSFRFQIMNFVEGIFQEKVFQVKEINGQKVQSIELFEYFKIYCREFDSYEMPNPKTLLQATAEANNLAAKAMAKDNYIKIMDLQFGMESPYMNPELVDTYHLEAKSKAIEKFLSIKKMGDLDYSKMFLEELVNELDLLAINYFKSNQTKKSNSLTRTPTTLISLMAFNYILSSLSSFFWLNLISSLCMIGFYLSFLTLLVWLFAKLKGEYKEFIYWIDFITQFVWDNMFQATFGRFVSNIFNCGGVTNLWITSVLNYGKELIKQDSTNTINHNPSFKGDSA